MGPKEMGCKGIDRFHVAGNWVHRTSMFNGFNMWSRFLNFELKSSLTDGISCGD